MSDKPVLQPGPDHPISVLANPNRVIVSVAGRVVANSNKALVLQEAAYPAVQYIPMADVDQTVLQRTDHSTHCPYKGDASYYSITVGGDRSVDAIWTYESPNEAVAGIKDHVAFYPDRVDAIAEQIAG
ncbi:DUF427 domain-containing protein [Nakamurella sp. PAMC28650]|uniref:DUF427 domain-containing protein n=1 Tax=Nakamurella sp. PAMC28650 TaxID=2762325 RepID=UPI00164E7B44|nr:DUF427 domain-containing protein [Nakamurella sp. PAMC28650]QNK83290.1 DUF427 domain-containing protein [Nakamurella sp. PAMC28650]